MPKGFDKIRTIAVDDRERCAIKARCKIAIRDEAWEQEQERLHNSGRLARGPIKERYAYARRPESTIGFGAYVEFLELYHELRTDGLFEGR